MTRFIISNFFLFLVLNTLLGQNINDTIHIINGSFEGVPGCCKSPTGWIVCGFEDETPPDIQPLLPPEKPLFGVTLKAVHGDTYIGMVIRQNGTYESIDQKLTKPLKADNCYYFSIYLSHSPIYNSGTRENYKILIPYTTPAVLRIWGGNNYCQPKELLGMSYPIENTEWIRFNFELSPKSEVNYIELEAYYNPSSTVPYNGNILLDHASDIILIPCKTDKEK
jgi:hypothetical protein